MLYIVVVLSLLSVAYAEGSERPKMLLPPLVRKAVRAAAAECIKETQVKQEIADNFLILKYENNADTKKFIYCLCRKTNYAYEDGRFNDNVIALFEKNVHKDNVLKVIDNCNNIKEKDNLETMFQVFMCFYNNTPVLVQP